MERKNSARYQKLWACFYGSSNDTTTNTTPHVGQSQFRYRYWNGRESKIHPTGGERGRGSTQQPTKPDSTFFLVGKCLVTDELPTRTPPTIQGKHQMKKKKNNISDRNGIFPPFHPSPVATSFQNKNNTPPSSSGRVTNSDHLFATVKNFKKRQQPENDSLFLSK